MTRRFDYMEKRVWSKLKNEIEKGGTFSYVVVGSEPATSYDWVVSFHDDLGEARKAAARIVDDATKISGWIFMSIWYNLDGSALPTGVELECLGYAYFGGDGDTYFHWEDDSSGDQDINEYPSEDKLDA